MERIEAESVIKRPAEAIFAYLTDSKNWPEWNSLVLETSAEETPLRKGSRVKAVGRLLGRRIETTSEITEHEPFTLTLEDTYTFEPAAGGTRVRYKADAETHGLFKLADPILARIVKKQTDSNFGALKEILEAEVPAAVTR